MRGLEEDAGELEEERARPRGRRSGRFRRRPRVIAAGGYRGGADLGCSGGGGNCRWRREHVLGDGGGAQLGSPAPGESRSWAAPAPGDVQATDGGRRRGGGTCLKRFSNHEGFFAKLSVNYAHDMFFGTEGVFCQIFFVGKDTSSQC